MFDSPDAELYRERADMHDQLARTTADEQARKMHQSMAAAYRRKAEEASGGMIRIVVPDDQVTARLLMPTGA